MHYDLTLAFLITLLIFGVSRLMQILNNHKKTPKDKWRIDWSSLKMFDKIVVQYKSKDIAIHTFYGIEEIMDHTFVVLDGRNEYIDTVKFKKI